MLGVVLRFLFQPHYPTCTMLKMVTMEQVNKTFLSSCLLGRICVNLIVEALRVRIIHKHYHAGT